MNKPLIFLAFADYRTTDDHLRELGAEQDGIVAALKEAKEAGLCDLITLADATVSKIQAVFSNTSQAISIFHFAGHASGYELLLKQENIHAEAFARFLGLQSGLQLVFLNGCSTQRQVKALQENGIPLVIATARSIEDEIACEFATYFYQQIGSGKSIAEAYQQYEYRHEIKNTQLRRLYHPKTPSRAIDRFPWELYVKQGAESAKDWNLPEAVGNPLFSLPSIPQNYDLPSQPFRYLHWFEREHAEVFFGRAYPIRDLYERVNDSLGAPIILLYGQSGVGKSSLLHAGLFPRLEEKVNLQYVRRQKDKGLLGTLQSILGKPDGGLDWRKLWNSKYENNQAFVVILDQVEETFTQALPNGSVEEEWGEFLEVIHQIFSNPNRRPNGKLILSYRKEYHSDIEALLEQKGLARAKLFLQPLQKKDIIQAIVGITQNERTQKQYGLQIEEGLPEIIADDLLEDVHSAIAPVLQILLTKLWETAIKQNETQPKFTIAAYQQLKKEGILLADFLQQQLLALEKLQPKASASGLILALLTYHTTLLGTAAKRTWEDLQQQFGGSKVPLRDLLTQLQDQYLLVATSDEQWSLAHDTLAPLTKERFDSSNKPAQQAARILKNKQLELQYSHQNVYLNEQELQIVEQGKEGLGKLDKADLQLLKESREEIERLKRENVWVDRIAKVGGTLLLAALVAAAWFWYWSNENQQVAEANEWLRKAAAVKDSDPTKSFHHAVKAWKLYPSGKALGYANEAMYRHAFKDPETNKFYSTPFYRPLNIKGDYVTAANFSADGKWIATATGAGIVKLFNLKGEQFVWRDGKLLQIVEDYSNRGGLVLMIKGESGRLEMVNMQGEAQKYRRFFPHHPKGKPITQVAFSSDNSMLAMGGEDSTAFIWNLKKGTGTELGKQKGAILRMFFGMNNQSVRAIVMTDRGMITGNSYSEFFHFSKTWNLEGEEVKEEEIKMEELGDLQEFRENILHNTRRTIFSSSFVSFLEFNGKSRWHPNQPYVVSQKDGNALLWNLKTMEIPKLTPKNEQFALVDSLFFKTDKVQQFLNHRLLPLKDANYQVNFLGFRANEITISLENNIKTDAVIHRFQNPDGQDFGGAALINENRQLATMSKDSSMYLWTIAPDVLADSVRKALYLKE